LASHKDITRERAKLMGKGSPHNLSPSNQNHSKMLCRLSKSHTHNIYIYIYIERGREIDI